MSFSACFIVILGFLTAVYAQYVSSAEFHAIVDSNDLTLAAFVVPWTPPCQSLASEWAAARSQLPEIHLISINCSAEVSLCATHNVHSYPTIRLFHGGSKRYRGPRKASAIVPFVKRASLPVVSTVDVNNITELLAIDGVTFVAYLNKDDTVSRARFTKLAEASHDDFAFGITTDKDLAKSENIEHLPSIVAYKTDVGDREILQSNGLMKRFMIEKFVVEAGTLLINELTRKNEMAFMSSHKLLAYTFVSNEDDRILLRRQLYPIAKTYKEYVNFVTIDSEEYGHMATSLGLSGDHYPAFTVYSAWKDQVFPFPQSPSGRAASVEAFLLDILQGNREPWDPNNPKGHHDEL